MVLDWGHQLESFWLEVIMPLVFEARLSWPSGLSFCSRHTSLFPLPWTESSGCFTFPGLCSLSLCL